MAKTHGEFLFHVSGLIVLLLSMVFLLAIPTFGLEVVTREIKFEDDPVKILSSWAYLKREEYSTELYCQMEYKNESKKTIDAVSFRMLFYDVFNEYLDTMSGISINGLSHMESAKSAWKPSIYKEWATHTVIIFLDRIRFKDGTIWRRDEIDITRELDKLKDILFKPEQLEEKRKE